MPSMPSKTNKTCLIIGNGPSLADIPNEFLDRYPTFGSNRVYLKYTPDYYACVNPLVIKQFFAEIGTMRCIKFIPTGYTHLVPGAIRLQTTSAKVFADREFTPVYEGYTVTYVLMQLAYWYGFRRVGLVGVDHSYRFDGQPNQRLTAEGADPNHFDPAYFSDGAVWNAPDLAKSEESYRLAKRVYELDGREIVNLSPESKLDIFKREDWHDW